MTEPKADEIAVQALSDGLVQQLSRMNLPSIAASAFVQANLCQAAFDGVLKLIKHKNLVGEAELAKCLADSYSEALSRVSRHGIAIATKMPTVGKVS